MRFLHFSHAGNDFVLRIVSFQTLKLCQERRIFWPPVGIEKDNRVRQLLLRCPMDNASKRRDANPAGEEYGRSRILLKNQIPGWPFDLNRGSKWHRPQHVLER